MAKKNLPQVHLQKKSHSLPCHGRSLDSFQKLHLLTIWLQALFVIDSESCQTQFPHDIAVLFYWTQSRSPQVVDLDLLLCTGFD